MSLNTFACVRWHRNGTIRVVLISSNAINLEKSDSSIRGVLICSNAKNREKFPL